VVAGGSEHNGQLVRGDRLLHKVQQGSHLQGKGRGTVPWRQDNDTC
jgi:hypothetical protein